MLGIHYLKANPTQHVIHFANGKARRSGPGLSFFYYQPSASIVVVPVGSADTPFIFNEITADFQPVTVQGQLTYHISDPARVAAILDYSIEGAVDKYRTEDPQKLAQRLVNLTQVHTRAELASLPLRDAIRAADRVASGVLSRLGGGDELKALGVEVLTFSILAIKPTPDIARALEAEARENLLRQADDAIYVRRNAAIEQERTIKENELNTEIAVQQKQRQIRETKAAADLVIETKEQEIRESRLAGLITLEEERKKFVAAQTENARAQADANAYAVRASLQPLTELSHEVLTALSTQTGDPRLMIAKAIQEIAQNASKIGQLNISPDLLETLLRKE
jgi:hypothetical protein